MSASSWRSVTTEAKLLLIGIPVLIWTMLPIYHLFLFAISPKESALGGQLWPDHPTLQNFRIVFQRAASLPRALLAADVELADHRGGGRAC